MPGDWLLLAFLISYCIAFDPWTWTLILGLWKLWCEQLCTNCTGGSSNASASAFLFFKHTHFNVISTPLCWHSVYTLYIQCIIHIYVFVCSFHVLQYAWNHLYHNHMPETLKLYFKKAQWHTGLKRIPHWMLQSHIPVSKQVWIHKKMSHHHHHHRHHHHRSVFAEYFNRFDGKVSPKHNNVKVFKNFYKAER